MNHAFFANPSKLVAAIMAAFLSLIPALLNAAVPSDLKAKLTAWLGERPGCVAAVYISDGNATFANAGQFSPADVRTPTSDTIFEIGSVTKVFTGLLLAEGERAGKVSRTDPAAKFLLSSDDPELPKFSSPSLLALSTHTSGLPRLPANFTGYTAPDPYAEYDHAALLAAFRVHGLFARNDASQSYSNFGVALLGEALGKAWGEPYAIALRDHVLGPLGLNHTTIATPHSPAGDGAAPALNKGKLTAYWTFDAMAPAGSLRSSTRDLALFLQACLGTRETPLAASLAESIKPLRATADFPGKIGLGWFITSHPTQPVIWHNGATGGFNSFVGFCPATGNGIAVATNSSADPTTFSRALITPEEPVSKSAEIENADEFTGSYSFTPQVSMIIVKRGRTLAAQMTAQTFLTLEKSAPDRFTVNGVAAELAFERDLSGKITALTLHQNNRQQRAARTTEIFLPPEKLSKLNGEFALSSLVTCTISNKDDRLFAQLTGQPRFPIFASAPGEFFFKVVNAQLLFEHDADGELVAVTLRQNGRETRMPRASP